MATKVFEIDLDIKDPKFKLVSPIEVVSGDTDTNIFNIQLFENFVPVNASGNTVVIIFGKPDNTTVFQNLTVVDATKGQYTCTLSSQTIAVPGRIKAEVALYEGIKRLTSTRFEFNVRKAILDENTVESSNEFSALTQALSEVTDLKNLAGVGRTTENVKENADNIGDLTTLETTEKTNLVGAINEVKDDVDNIKLTADNVEYNNTESGLEAEDVQGAIDEVVDDLDSHLAEIMTQSIQNLLMGDINVSSRSRGSGIISFISDDGKIEDYTILKPIFESNNEVFASAVVTDFIDTDGYMSIEQIKSLESYGCEILSHCKSHIHLAQQDENIVNLELKKSKDFLLDMGVDVNNVVYPFGSYNNLVKKIARKYYRSGFSFDRVPGVLNSQPYDTYAIKRISLGAYFDIPNNEYPITNTFNDYYKPMIDKCMLQNQWLIITLHPGASNGDFTEEQKNYLIQTIQYIKSKNIPIKTPNEVLNEMGNILDIVSYSNDNNSESIVRIGGNGKIDITTPKLEIVYPELLNGWESDANNPVRYSVDLLGNVHIRGGAIPTNSTHEFIFNMPSKYRPKTSFIVVLPGGADINNARVGYVALANGRVGVVNVNKDAPYYALDSLNYNIYG